MQPIRHSTKASDQGANESLFGRVNKRTFISRQGTSLNRRDEGKSQENTLQQQTRRPSLAQIAIASK
jgi:hypothetical protein